MRNELCALRALVIDVDGVLWRGKHFLPGIPAFFDFLETHHIKFVIATNNSARPTMDITARLQHVGVSIDPAQVLTSAEATARYLSNAVPSARRVYVVGGEGLCQAMSHAGFQLVEQDADAVVVGIDFALTYEKLKRATREIRRGAKFIGTNADKTLPVDEDVVPGAGSILAALVAATDVKPIVIGKPERALFDIAIEKMGASRETTATLGDRLDTDIEGGMHAGLQSILVMTGVTTPAMLAASSVKPDFVFADLDTLREAWARCY